MIPFPNKNCKLTPSEEGYVYEIHRLRNVERWTQTAIANRFGYNQSNITTILGGKRWKHVYERFWNDNPKLKKVKRSSQKSMKKTEGFGL